MLMQDASSLATFSARLITKRLVRLGELARGANSQVCAMRYIDTSATSSRLTRVAIWRLSRHFDGERAGAWKKRLEGERVSFGSFSQTSCSWRRLASEFTQPTSLLHKRPASMPNPVGILIGEFKQTSARVHWPWSRAES